MAFEFKFPDVGEGIHEGEIVRWRVKVGDEVKEDQPLIEVETAKAIVELPCPKSGTILAILPKEGEIVKVGQTLVAIGEKGEKWSPAVGEKQQEGGPKVGPGVVGEIPTEEKGVVLPSRQAAGGRTAAPVQQNVLPRLRKLAVDLGVDLAKIKGTGPGRQITEQDIKNAAMPSVDYAKWGPIEKVPLKGMRKIIADHMVRSAFTIPHVTHIDECDATTLVKAREAKKAEAMKIGVKLTYLPFIIKATIETLKKHPVLNATIDDLTQEIVYKKYYNIGIAVDTPDGLMVPVIKDADKKDIWELAKDIVDLATKCRDKKITPAELEGGSFTITNIGSIGGIYATPIIPYGQSGVLGVMRMKEKPLALDGKIEIRPVLSLALSFDHRALDGAQAARAMNELINLLENFV